MTTVVFSPPATASHQINSTGGTYAQRREGTASLAVASGGTVVDVGQLSGFVIESFLSFDTSSIPDAAVITQVVLEIFVISDQSATNFTLEARLHDWGTTLETADFVAGSALSGKTLLATRATSGLVNTAYNAFTESGTDFRTSINKTGSTRMVLASDRQRVGTEPSGNEYISYSRETAGQHAKLTVTYGIEDQVAVDQVIEADTTSEFVISEAVTLDQATEADSTFAFRDLNTIDVNQAIETDSTFSVLNSAVVPVKLVTELDKTSTVIPTTSAVMRLGGPFPRATTLGSGEYQCLITRRGGGPVVLEVAFSSLNISRVVDDAGSATINLPATSAGSAAACCEVISEVEPWRDEIVIYRNNDIAFVGPVITLDGKEQTLFARDLFHWTERRFIEEDLHYWDDVAYTFRSVFNKAMEPDPSPNIDIVVHRTGVSSVRNYKGADVPRAADLLRELARTALDFTTVGRTVYAGGKEVFAPEGAPAAPLLLHDGGVLSAAPIKDGERFATDVAVFAGTGNTGGREGRTLPLVGRARRQTEVYGLVQSTATELLINDLESANQNALSRLESMQPTPLRFHVVFSPEAAFEFTDIIPGRRVDARLSETSCLETTDVLRLPNFDISVGPDGETIEGDLVPLGEFQDA